MDARASKKKIEIATAKGDSVLHFNAAGTIARDAWALPGLAVKVETDATGFEQAPAEGGVEVRYRGATKIVLHFATDR